MDMMFFILMVFYHTINIKVLSALKSITISPTFHLKKTQNISTMPTEFLHQPNQTLGVLATSAFHSKSSEVSHHELTSSSIQQSEERKHNTLVKTTIYQTSSSWNHTVFSSMNFSAVIPPCPNCSNMSVKDREFSYIMLGIGIGSTFFIFIMVLFVVILKRIHEKRRTRGENPLGTVREDDDFLRSKESIFSSSTLQLHGGLTNDGLELDSFQSPTGSHGTSKPSSESHLDNVGKPNSLHLKIETCDVDPHFSQSPSLNQLEHELAFDASVKLLQEWSDDLDDDDSDQYKELKLEVEQTVKDIYKIKDEFRGVKLSGFRKGSVIADMMLIMLAVVQNPFDLLEKSVSKGKLGRFNVDRSYFVKRTTEDENDMEKHRSIPFGVVAREQVIEDYQMKEEISELNESNLGLACEYEWNSSEDNLKIDSSNLNPDDIDSSNGTVLTRKDWTKRKSSLGEVVSDRKKPLEQEARLKGRQHSLADLRMTNTPVAFRELRDSGIGSMQELDGSELKLNKTAEKSDDAERVFYDIPESSDMPLYKVESRSFGSVQQLDQIDEDIPHVAMYNFQAENDHELSIKQGDVVHMINRSLAGWVKVVNAEDKIGWVPESFLVHVSPSQLSDTQQTVETLEFFDSVLEQLDNESASSSSAASTPDDDECDKATDKGSTIELEGEAACVIVELDKSQNKIEIQVKRCKSVYRFDGKDSSELSFNVGEIIEVLKISEVGWWKGKLRENRGWFPSSYVMPLNEESEVPVKSRMISDFDRIISGRFRESDRGICLRRESDINERRKSNFKNNHRKYQSLQRTARKKEEYAHLYFQILRRESKSDENIPSLFKSASFNVINNINAPDWPNRAPPVPPNDDSTVDDIASKPPVVKSKPPNRPVPHPPSAKPSFTKFDIIKKKMSSENALIGKTLPEKIIPPSRTKHEHFLLTQTKPEGESSFHEAAVSTVISAENERITGGSTSDHEMKK